LNNDPGIVDLVATAYKGQLLAKNIADPHYRCAHSDAELAASRIIIEEGKCAELRVISYVDTIQTAVNPKEQCDRTPVVPVPHPCSRDMTDFLDDSAGMDDHYADLINCVQRHVCRPNGYCKSKTGGYCRFKFPFSLQSRTKLEFEAIGRSGGVRASIVHKRNDQFLNVHNRVHNRAHQTLRPTAVFQHAQR
jgi:hypothetical protein